MTTYKHDFWGSDILPWEEPVQVTAEPEPKLEPVPLSPAQPGIQLRMSWWLAFLMLFGAGTWTAIGWLVWRWVKS